MSVRLLKTVRFNDSRGWFCESWSDKRLDELGSDTSFCQDNHSLSRSKGTLRGIHFQRLPHAQAKLVRCTRGRIWDVAVDLRPDSPTFKKWVGVELSEDNGYQLFIPQGYGHAFLTLEDNCEVMYKVDNYYSPESDAGIIWNDKDIAINWPDVGGDLFISEKDNKLPDIKDISLEFPFDGNPLMPIDI